MDDEAGVLMPMLSMCANLDYEYTKGNEYYTITNGLRTIKVPTNRQVAYIDGQETEFEYRIINDDIYFPYKYLDMLFDLDINWDSETKCLTLTERESTPVSDSELAFRNEALTLYVSSDNDILNLSLNDNEIKFPDAQPFVDENGRTQVPIRAVSEMLDCTVDWNDITKTATVTHKNGDTIALTFGSDVMIINGKTSQMDTAAMIKDDRIYIPVRFVAEALGLTVEWVQ